LTFGNTISFFNLDYLEVLRQNFLQFYFEYVIYIYFDVSTRCYLIYSRIQ